MIKVLVAEDELPLLRGISRLIESLCEDFHVVMMAKTGKEALDYLKNHSVDVVFTDINMPVIDGLQVLKYINRNTPWIIRVVISGYQDFSYAQQAVKYEAKSYLIKPVDKQELSLLLSQLRESLLSHAADWKSHLLEQMIYGQNPVSKYNAQYDSHRAAHVEFYNLYPVYLIAKAYCSHSMEEENFGMGFWQDIRLSEYIEELMPGLTGIYTYYGKNPNEIMLLLESENEADVKSLVRSLFKEMRLTVPVAAAVGAPIRDTAAIRSSMKQLRAVICMGWMYGTCGLVEGDRSPPSFYMTKATEEALKYMVQNGKLKDFQTILSEIQTQMCTLGITQYDLELTLNKIVLLIQAYSTMLESREIENISFDMNDIVARADSLKAVFEEFTLWCHDIMFPGAEETTEALVRRLDSYIQSHYTKRLSTNMLASEFGLVPSYLSRLFREYKGITPNHYIQEIRIGRAEELLVNCPSIMTKDIALMVGYTDPSYFSKVFKKSTGLYPSEYRMANLKQEVKDSIS